jgi:DNA-binding CsgD family transcriptional regulator/tetratricopeptide (TPR) repeat protein
MHPDAMREIVVVMHEPDEVPDHALRLLQPGRRAGDPDAGGTMYRPPRGLFGRDRELTEADEALAVAASGTPQVLLIGGDAGIGKTTLARAVADRARARGFMVFVGHCLDIDRGAALQPVREALRGALALRPDDDLPPVTRRLAEFLRGGSQEAARDDLGLAVAELVAESPLLLLLEDMHWADRSTQDLAVSLSHTALGRLCLALTYRADELTRRHPFRRALVEIGRSAAARRIDLTPLDREGIAGIIEASTGRRDNAMVGSVLARSEGNPLYAEELLEVGPQQIPGPLADLLLARVDVLSTETRNLLRLASANGSRLEPSLLAEVSGLSGEAMDTCLGEAIDANVLRIVDGHLDFRHGLLREAVYDDLLPGERTRAHERLAKGVQHGLGDDPALAELGLLAFHCYAAHDLPAAYQASARAGFAARKFGAFAEAIAHLGRALELYDRVPHDDVTAPAKADLVRVLAESCSAHSEHERAEQLLRQALSLLDDDSDPLLMCRVYSTYATLCQEFEGYPSHREALEKAIAAAEGEPSEELANALVAKAEWHLRHEQFAAAAACADRSIDVARAICAPVVESMARHERSMTYYALGRFSDAYAEAGAAANAAEQPGGSPANALWSELFGAEVLVGGLDPPRGLDLAQDLRARALAHGLPEVALFAGTLMVFGLVLQGRLDEATLLESELVEEGYVPDDPWRANLRSLLLLARGDLAAALPRHQRRIALLGSLASLPDAKEVLLHIEVLVGNALVHEALTLAHRYLKAFEGSDGPLAFGCLASGTYLVLAAARRAGLQPDQELLERADTMVAKAEASLPLGAYLNWEGVDVLIARARRADLVGDRSVDAWRATYDACSRIGAGIALPVRLGLVSALLTAGERDEARTMLPEVWQAARAMGAHGVEADALRLGRRHRLPLPDQPASPLDVLTAREREVLTVLATGATNAMIAERLFISKKTVSVHVTNVLAKLGVTNRGEAAALARELAPAD